MADTSFTAGSSDLSVTNAIEHMSLEERDAFLEDALANQEFIDQSQCRVFKIDEAIWVIWKKPITDWFYKLPKGPFRSEMKRQAFMQEYGGGGGR